MKYNIELLRLIAVILITFTHTRHNFSDGITFFILEKLPSYGTFTLSIISGYLYFKISRKNKNLFSKKIKSLVIPYLIANISVLVIVLLFSQVFNIDYLNRLGFNASLFYEGILSLNSPPINPPTFFIRDIFIIFVLIEVILNRKYKLLAIIIPLLIFGQLLLRYDIIILFIMGVLIAKYLNKENSLYFKGFAFSIFLILFYLNLIYFEYFLSILIFLFIINYEFKFFNVGGYTYLLHLYHSPIIVFIYPIIDNYIFNPHIKIILQITLSMCFVYLLFLITRKFKFLRILSGQR